QPHDLAARLRRLVAEELGGAELLLFLLMNIRYRRLGSIMKIPLRLLLLHLHFEAGLVDGEAALLGDHPRQIDRKPICIVELENSFAGQYITALEARRRLV